MSEDLEHTHAVAHLKACSNFTVFLPSIANENKNQTFPYAWEIKKQKTQDTRLSNLLEG